MRRTLTTVENRDQTIINKTTGTIGVIKGSYIGGFVVYLPNEAVRVKLPFENVEKFEALE